MTRGSRRFGAVLVAILALASAALGQQAADPYQAVLRYKFDQPRTAVMAIEAQIRAATPGQLRAIEGKLLGILQSPEATTDAKAWVCRQLRQAGSEKSVDALVPLLGDKDLATVARLSLQSTPGKKVDEALRNAIGKLKGDLLAGVLQTIGVRGDRQAVPLVVPILAGNKDPVVVEAALFALGHIGGGEALRAVQAAKVADRLNRARCHAILLCAERIAADGQKVHASVACQALFNESNDIVIKTGALRAVVLYEVPTGRQMLVSALKSDRPRLQATAAKILCESCSGETLSSVLADLSTLRPGTQAAVLTMVTDKAALPAIRKAVQSSDPVVRREAMAALGRLGDASSVPLLLGISARRSDAYDAAGAALQAFRGEDVVAALIVAAQKGELAERITAIRILGWRGDRQAVPVLLNAAEEPNPDLQIAALDALRRVAEPSSLPALVQLLLKSKSEPAQRFAEGAAIEACRRNDNKDAAAATVLAALPGSSAPVRCALLRVLACAPGSKSLEALRAAVDDGDATVADAAIRGLAEWPNPAAAADLLAIGRSDKSPTLKLLALRGAIRLAGPAGKLPAEQAVKLLADAMTLAARTEEKKLALAALSEVDHPAALELASKCLSDPALELEAATAVVKIAKSLRATNPDAAAAAIQKVLDVCKSPAARQPAESAMIVLGGMVNIAPQGTATSPDGLDKDGDASGDQAAIDGDPATYWDEADGQKLYRLVVTFQQPEKIAAISILGYAHHNYAPKDLEVLCDGRVVKKVENAQYDSNFLLLRIDEATCKSVELKITGYYGNSPAIRELGIYRAKGQK